MKRRGRKRVGGERERECEQEEGRRTLDGSPGLFIILSQKKYPIISAVLPLQE